MLETLRNLEPDATWRHDGHRIDLYLLGSDGKGKALLGYRIFDHGRLVDEQDDLHCSPMHAPVSLETVCDIISFATWDNQYTRGELEQRREGHPKAWLDWISGYRAECLSMAGTDLDDTRHGETIHAMRIDCPACGEQTAVYDDWIGRQRCMWCGQTVHFPGPVAA